MGIVITAITVIRHWPRKIRMINEQRTAPRTPSSARLSIELRTYTDWSMTTFRSMSGCVSFAFISGTAAFSPLTTLSVLVPIWR